MKVSVSFIAAWLAFVAQAAYDQNRAGAVLKAPSGSAFKSVTGTFTVPEDLTGDNRLSVWVGIGDSLTQTYVLGGGVSFNKTLSTWSGFFPGTSVDTTAAVPASSGDNVTVTVNIETGAGGSVTIENLTQNKKTTQEVSAPGNADPSALTALVADWWVQAYQVIPGELVKVPNFGTITFTGVSATTHNGTNVPVSGAGAYEIQGSSGEMWSNTTISSSGISVRRRAGPGCDASDPCGNQ
ncbi:concanavalin A-like lectin/glucanase [Bimuria novae-zelandiae CBS 107.79]|uniref:Concanavalin A-like lectin/glucanase n=1 Tax=Bimuria novae-zelandiae CBS 107.79 TaxID=1447943 RepID=A0A6A5UQ45_9PLEO|nr:concanavalin A-like lectin/glucanase [Bimuria novae-zelandiae CBS 107.79]